MYANIFNLLFLFQDIFVTLSTVDDSLYFMCNVEDFKFLADMIQHVPLPLRARYVFCCSPINRKMPFVCSMFLKVIIIIFFLSVIVNGPKSWLKWMITFNISRKVLLRHLLFLNMFRHFTVVLMVKQTFDNILNLMPL